jgi:hypothetical protein
MPKMIKFKIFVLFLFAAGNLSAQDYRASAREVSLTLIPPSPVTDQINLDVRGGVKNNTHYEMTFNVTFYLDKEVTAAVLHQQKIIVGPESAKEIKFRWATKGKVGLHKIILIGTSGNHTFRRTAFIQVIASSIPSTKQIDGAFINFYHWSEEEGKFWNPAIKNLTDKQWGELIGGQHSLGMNIILVQELFRNQEYAGKHNIEKEGYKGRAFYPSKVFPSRMPIAANDPLEAVLLKADKDGMSVFIAVGLYAWFDFTNGSLEWHKKVAEELWKKYGHHPSFYGWYVSEEMDGGLGDEQARKDIVGFFKNFSAFVHQLTPGKPVMLATNSHNLRGAEDTYRKLLPYLDILCTFGFHRMPATDLTGEQAADKLQVLCNEAGIHFWMDMEVFDFTPENALVPRSIKGLLSDLHRFPNFEKIICYQYPGLLNSPSMSVKPGGEHTVKLYVDYKKYLDSLRLSSKK